MSASRKNMISIAVVALVVSAAVVYASNNISAVKNILND